MKRKLCFLLLTVLFCNCLAGCTGSYDSLSNEYTSSMSTVTNGGNFYADALFVSEESIKGSIEEGVEDFNTEEYDYIERNDFLTVVTNPLSTFAMDVDTGSYPNLRRMLNDGYVLDEIPNGAIRTEEMLNYFEFNFENEAEGDRFNITYEINECPWNTTNKIVAMSIEAKEPAEKQAGRNFVILFDTSGSMDSEDKGGLALKGCKLLFESFTEEDTVSIVTYAGDKATIIEGCSDKTKLNKALNKVYERLEMGGGTNGSGGIERAYELAEKYFIEGGNNRVILFSDGDMNLGITDQSELIELIKSKARESGVFLTTLGFGSGNYSDSNMESLANYGNGNYYYIDCLEEAQRVLVDRLNQSTETIAKDVKLQVEFNPKFVSEYRLLGYENRMMNAEDFENDEKDGGETGAGQRVAVLYEIKEATGNKVISNLKYQDAPELSELAENTSEIMSLSIRYKEPDGVKSSLEEFPIVFEKSDEVSKDFSFACGVARLVDYITRDDVDSDYIEDLLKYGLNDDYFRKELLELVDLYL